MVITRVEKATIAGLAVGGIGVALAAGYAEVKDMKPSKNKIMSFPLKSF